MPSDLHYLFPFAIYLIFLLIPIVWVGWRLFEFRKSSLEKFASKEVLQKIMVPRSRFNFWAKLATLSIIWICALVALMQPVGNGHYPIEQEKEVLVKRKAHDLIILLDASASMELKDTRTGVSRFDYGKEIGDEIVSQLKGESVALHAFTSGTTKLSPITLDYLFIRIMLKQMGINEGDIAGTDLKAVLNEVQKQYFSTIAPKQRTLIILSDGGDTQAEALEGGARDERIEEILTPLSQAELMHLRVFVVGLGSKEGEKIPGFSIISKLDENLLIQLSQKGRGKYYDGNGMTAVAIADDIIEHIGKDKLYLQDYGVSPMRGKEDLVFDLYFQYPLGMALFLTAFLLCFPDTRKKKGSFLLLLIPFQVHGEIGREAAGYYEAGAYDQAIERYQELENRNLLDWQQAAVEYNRATSVLMKGDWEASVEMLLAIRTSSPPLQRKIANTLAIARYWQAQQNLNKGSFTEGIFLLREALATNNDPELRKEIKRELALALDRHLEFLIQESEAKVGLPVLLSGIQLILSDIQLAKNKHYAHWIVRDMDEWLRLWQSQRMKIPELAKSEKEFKEGLAFLVKGELEKSQRSLQAAADTLLKMIREIFGDDPLIQSLQNLLLTYYRTLNQDPLQEAAIYRLQLEQKQIDQPDSFLDKTITSIQEGKNFEARIYVEEARQEIRRAMRALTSEKNPKSTLEESIQDQQHALSVDRLLQRISNPSEELIALSLKAQEQTVKTAEPFWDQALEKQEREFPQRCQCKPWNEVLPLYEKGLNAAKAFKQESALNYWQDALDRLLGKERKVAEPVKEEKKPLKAVLQELQQMEQDDRRPRAVERVKISGERSW